MQLRHEGAIATSIMVPVGLVTQNRVTYLDVTLRSLSASAMPQDTPFRLFDDHTHDLVVRDYYTTTACVHRQPDWPTYREWHRHNLYTINLHSQPIYGIHGKVRIVDLPGDSPMGVVNASCYAAASLFAEFKEAPGVLLLQDDVIFTDDWYSRMLQTAAQINQDTAGRLGVLAGIKLNQYWQNTKDKAYIESGITAQCLYITRAAYEQCSDYFHKSHVLRMRFDDTLRNTLASAGFWCGSILPFIGQHFGIVSRVRPNKQWHSQAQGRVGYYTKDPLVLGRTVRQFS